MSKRPNTHALVLMWALFSATAAGTVEAQTPGWRHLEPPLVLSPEGFRGVKWCTPLSAIPWKRDPSFSYPAALFVRRDEDLSVFGQQASAITYTLRNSVLYGVRIDFRGTACVGAAMEACAHAYPPLAPPVAVDTRQQRWHTAFTSVWVTLPATQQGMGHIFLWGRDRKFADDTPAPVYFAARLTDTSHQAAYQPRHYVIYRTSAPVTVDGHLTEKAWQDAAWTDAFEDHQAPFAPPPWKMTRAKMLYDDSSLYVAARLQEENVWGQLTRRDTIVYFDNDFEIFLDPTANGVDYFEFELTCLNTMFDMFHENDNNRGALADRRFDAPGARHAVQVQGTLNYHHDEDEGWTVEISIPFADLQDWNPAMHLPVRRGDLWRINFSRVEYLHVYHQLFPYLLSFSPCEDWVWNTVHAGSIHVPEMWGKAVFSDLPAGAGRDEGLERGCPLLEPPEPPAQRRQGMVYFPACAMTLGPDPTDPVHSPAHQVQVPAFYMDRYEVTVEQYARFLNQGEHDAYYDRRMAIAHLCGITRTAPGKYQVVPGRQHYPVVFVQQPWALAYAQDRGLTLPTEAMWERAAVGVEGRKHPWGDAPLDPRHANYDFHYGGTLPVGSLAAGATPEGIYDLSGNAREWTTSKIDPYPGGAEYSYHIAPWWYPGQKRFNRIWCVARGGGWSQQSACMSPRYRNSLTVMDGGFRCVRLAQAE